MTSEGMTSEDMPSEGMTNSISFLGVGLPGNQGMTSEACMTSEASMTSEGMTSAGGVGHVASSESKISIGTVSKQSQRLSANLDADLLRAVRSARALRYFGTDWQAIGRGVYELSENVTTIDDFLSHDWQTGRWPKFFSLCFTYNGWMAFSGSLGIGIVLSIVQAASPALLPNIGLKFEWQDGGGFNREVRRCPWCTLICPVVFFSILLFGQRILSMFPWRQRMVFLDKHCIHQTDPDKKAAAVYGLAGFLQSSERLVVLWSPSYFTRLWCTYELASWFRLKRDAAQGTIKFVPVSLAMVCATVVLSHVLSSVMWHFSKPLFSGLWYIALAFAIGPIFFAAPYIRQGMRELMMIPTQLSTFSIRAAGCFCCTQGHRHPQTGEELSCDRASVYEALQDWLGKSKVASGGGQSPVQNPQMNVPAWPAPAQDTSHLDAFDRRVQQVLGPKVTCTLNINYTAALAASSPWLWRGLDAVAESFQVDLVPALRANGELVIFTCAVLPCAMKYVLSGVERLESLGALKYESWLANALVTFAYSCSSVAVFLVMWFPLHFSVNTLASPWHQLAVSMALVCVTVVTFTPKIQGWVASLFPSGSHQSALPKGPENTVAIGRPEVVQTPVVPLA